MYVGDRGRSHAHIVCITIFKHFRLKPYIIYIDTKINNMTRTSKKDTSEARLTAVEAGMAKILEMLSEMSKTQTVAPSSASMTEEERQEQIENQNEQLTAYCKKNNLVMYEITGYSFKSADGKSVFQKDGSLDKADIDEILNCKDIQKESNLNSGYAVTCSVFPAEILKVE